LAALPMIGSPGLRVGGHQRNLVASPTARDGTRNGLGTARRMSEDIVTNPIRTFEAAVLRPFGIALIVASLWLFLCGLWPWAIGSLTGLVYLGLVESRLRVRGSALGFATGRWDGSAPGAAAETLAPDQAITLVGGASTRVGTLFGVVIAEVLYKGVGWDWYPAMVLGLVAMLVIGFALKLVFCVRIFPSARR
jgi:hypothetical protein